MRLIGLAFAEDMADALESIADQIEREVCEECDRCDEELCEAQMDRTRVMSVYLEMSKHVSGVEGAEDSPVARWARELRDALGGEGHDLTDEDREAIAWVREHGGLEKVRSHWDGYVPAAWLDRVKMSCERKRDRLKGHAWELERKCAERRERIAELERERDELRAQVADMRPRLMPEGMEWLVESWPRFEDDAPLKFGDMALIDGEDDMVEAVQLWIHGKPVIYGDGGSQQLDKGERVKRPEIDSWERLEEDAAKNPFDYCKDVGHRLDTCENSEAYKARDIVRRAKELAERGQ